MEKLFVLTKEEIQEAMKRVMEGASKSGILTESLKQDIVNLDIEKIIDICKISEVEKVLDGEKIHWKFVREREDGGMEFSLY